MRRVPSSSPADLGTAAQVAARIVGTVEQCMLGVPRLVRLAVATQLAGGHLLVEDVPGVGKTTLARALAHVTGGEDKRIQFTPDLLPADVTGSSILVQDSSGTALDFRPGPVFANVVVADELNRASPRTQSALLEVMQERTVSVDGTTHHVPDPFLVVATQNPIDSDGTYRLPAAQLDRFLIRTGVDPLGEDAELALLRGTTRRAPEDLPTVTSPAEMSGAVAAVATVQASDAVLRYIAHLCRGSRNLEEVAVGVSPRGALSLLAAARAWAVLHARDHVLPEDVQDVAEPVLAHRLVLTPAAELGDVRPAAVIAEMLATTSIPSALRA